MGVGFTQSKTKVALGYPHTQKRKKNLLQISGIIVLVMTRDRDLILNSPSSI